MTSREPRDSKGMFWLYAFFVVAAGLPVFILLVALVAVIFSEKGQPLYEALGVVDAIAVLLWFLLTPIFGGMALKHRGKKIETFRPDVLAKN